jgi:eukaryotic-like serine/threonine-protein kinase
MRGADLTRAGGSSCSRCGFVPDSERPLNFCPECGQELREPTPPLPESAGTAIWSGQVIAERYRLLELLGEGGMGTVFKAEHIRMGKTLALKLLRGAFAEDPDAVARFRAEAQIVSRLSHPHTIAVFDFGEIGDHGFYLAMEYVPGRDLARLLEESGPIGERRALGIAEQVLGSLAEAHAVGVVHRDVKPGNVMLSEQCEGDFVKLLDFGIAKLRAVPGSLGAAGAILGTPSYLAPEQALGAEVDGRADLYAVGALLYELVAGQPPFKGTAATVRAAHIHLAPPPLADLAPVSAGFVEAVHRALAKRPEERFPSAHAMRDALLAVRDRLPKEERGAWAEEAAPAGHEEGPEVSLGLASRDDFEALERDRRALRPSRLLLPVLLVAALLVAALVVRRGDVYALLARYAPSVVALMPASAGTEGEEREPNDTAASANPLALPALGTVPALSPPRGKGVIRGHIGTAIDAETGDADVFRVTVPEGGERPVLVAEWAAEGTPDQGIPGLDVKLTLNRAPGPEDDRREAPFVAQAHRGAGQPVRLVALVSAGSYFLAVREVHPAGARPVEKPDAAYLLRAWVEEAKAGEEVEPNDEPLLKEGVEPGYADWREVGERNPLGEGTRITGATSPEDDDTYAVGPRSSSERPELVLLLPTSSALALTAEVWMPAPEDLVAGARGTHFKEGGDGDPGEVVALRLPAQPAASAPALVRLRAALGEGGYDIMAVGSGPTTGSFLRGRLDALAASGRGPSALELAAAFAQALPRAPARDEVLLAAGALAARLAPTLRPEGLAGYRRVEKLLRGPLFEVVKGEVRDRAAFELLVEGSGDAAEAARFMAVNAACTPDDVGLRSRGFLERFPHSRRVPEVLLALARAEEEIYFRDGAPVVLKAALAAYEAVAVGAGPGAPEARSRIHALSRRHPLEAVRPGRCTAP